MRKDDIFAFPVTGEVVGDIDDSRYQPGMTLRDYFAGQAMIALINRNGIYKDLGQASYAAADALIEAREA